MKKYSNYGIIFSLVILLFLGIYWFLNSSNLRVGTDGILPAVEQPRLTSMEMGKILSTLDARYKENFTIRQKTMILNSLSAPK